VRDLAAALLRQGEDVCVLAGGEGILFDQLTVQDVPFHRLKHLVRPIRPWKDWNALWEIRKVLKELNPDLAATHSNKAGLLGRLAARSLSIPVVHTSHGFLFSGRPYSLAGRFYRLMEKLAAGLGHKVIAVSQSEFTAAQKYNVIPAEKMVLVHNGLPDPEPKKIALPDAEPPRLVMVARFAEPKDHLTLIGSLANLKDLSWNLQLVGDGPGKDRAERLVNQLGLADRVVFPGVCTDTISILADCQVFILSSLREGFPLSILEAMRTGLPVVATAVGGVGEAVVEGKTGFLVPPGEVNELQKKLEVLIRDPQLRKEMGRAGRERYLEHFTLDRMVEKTTIVYREICTDVPQHK